MSPRIVANEKYWMCQASVLLAKWGSVTVAGAGIFFAATAADAAGFAIREQSATALGNAFAGSTAGAEDISYMFFNPAGLSRQVGNQVLVVGSYIAPWSEFHPEGASTIAPISAPITGGNGGSDVAPNGFVPAAYAMWDVAPRFKLGLSVNVPYALETDYDSGWIGRYHALHSEINAITANPVFAYRITDQLSLGAGLIVQYIQANLSNAIDFGTIGFASAVPGAVPTAQDGSIELDGNDLSVGFNVGILYEPWNGTRFGIAYRSPIRHTLEGDANFTLDSAGTGALLSAATGAFRDTAAEADLTTPETLSLGIHHDINAQWSVMAEAAWTNWSRFEELRIRFANPSQPDSVTEQDWGQSWFFAAGLTYRPTDSWTLRSGIAYDSTPISDDRRTPRIPTDDRTWISVGASYEPSESVSISFGYAHLFVDRAPIDQQATSPGNTFRGNISGQSDDGTDIITFQVAATF